MVETPRRNTWGEPKAAYSPTLDIILMPERGAFLNPESLYAVWAHEHIHYTGHKSRLDRDLKSRFDRDAYAFEELVAEIGAAMACAHLQVKGELRLASYVDHWLKVLKQDSRAILSAASMASKATDYLRAFSEEKQDQADDPHEFRASRRPRYSLSCIPKNKNNN